MKLIGASTTVGALGTGHGLANSSAINSNPGKGVRFLNVGSIGGGSPLSATVDFAVGSDVVAADLSFGELSDPVDISTGSHTIDVSTRGASEAVAEPIKIQTGSEIIAFTGGLGEEKTGLETLSFKDLIGEEPGAVSVVNLTDSRRIEVDLGDGFKEVPHGDGSPPTNRAEVLDRYVVRAEGATDSWKFDRRLMGTRSALILVSGLTSDAGLPLGTKAVYRGN